MFMFHHCLVNERMAPADALRATQLWLLDPERRPPSGMSEVFIGDLAAHDFTDVTCWAAFSHQGR
jgi:CHAT domain-containing protein